MCTLGTYPISVIFLKISTLWYRSILPIPTLHSRICDSILDGKYLQYILELAYARILFVEECMVDLRTITPFFSICDITLTVVSVLFITSKSCCVFPKSTNSILCARLNFLFAIVSSLETSLLVKD